MTKRHKASGSWNEVELGDVHPFQCITDIYNLCVTGCAENLHSVP